MKNYLFALLLLISAGSFAQHNGFSLSAAGIRIYDASSSVLSEINGIEGKENRLVQVGKGISQSDFDAICSKFKWMRKFSVENTDGDITDFSSLKKLKQLEFLQLKNVASGDTVSLASLGELPALKDMHVFHSLVKDVDALANLPLENVSFDHSPLRSLAFLSQMKGLKKLNVAGANHAFANYDTLAKLNQLTLLNVSENPQATAENLDVFSGVTTLVSVDVSHCNNLKSLGFLYGSTGKLQEFYAVGCEAIGNFDMLIRCQKLKKVDISHSSAKNVKFLQNKSQVKDLRLSHTAVSSIDEIAASVGLERLDISFTQVGDISVLRGMGKLKRLNLSHSNVVEVSALAGCVSLTDFDCSSTQVASVEGMEACEKLTKINVGNTLIKELKPFYSAKKITSIVINENARQIDIDALKRRSPLIVIDVAKPEE